MTMENLSDILKSEAIERNLCARWTSEWADSSDQQELIDKYVRGIDFIIRQGEWPANDFIKANFDRDLLHLNRIFVDEDIDLADAPSGIYIVNGSCRGTIRLEPWAVATFYVRHNSDIRIVAGRRSRAFIRLYDRSDVKSVAGADAEVRVYDRRKTDSET